MRGGSSPKKGGQAAQALGRSRGGFSTKIHLSVDGLGNPLRFILTGGQQHDITQAEGLIAGYAGEHVLADQGYDAQEFRQHIPDEQEAHVKLGKRFIEQEVETLSRPSHRGEPVPAEASPEETSPEEASPEEASPEEALPEVAGRTGTLVLERVETVNIYVTIVNGGTGAEPPLFTVQGR